MGEGYYNLDIYDILSKLYNRKPKGFSEQEVEEAEKRLGIEFPKEMRKYYIECGKEDINYCLHRLIEPDNIEFTYEYIKGYERKQTDNYLIFWVENQGCCYWGIKVKDLSNDNPEVYITTNDDLISWEVVSNSFKSFAISMLLEQMTDSKWEYFEGYDEEVYDIINEFNIDILKLLPQKEYPNNNIRIVTYFYNKKLFIFLRKTDNINELEYVMVVNTDEINEY